MGALLSNLHLLLRVPSFSRWPLQLHFFSRDVYNAWLRTSSNALEDVRDSLPIITDFPPLSVPEPSITEPGSSAVVAAPQAPPSHGIAALDIGYAAQKAHIAKSTNILDFEREGSCKLCSEALDHDTGIYAICSHSDCESVTHLTCLSAHFLQSEPATSSLGDGNGAALVPIQGACPSCGGKMRWVDVVKEVSLRMRGGKEVEQLLKKPRVKAVKASPSKKGKQKEVAVVDPIVDSDLDELTALEDEEGDYEDDLDDQELDVMEDDAKVAALAEGNSWFVIDDSYE